MHRLPPASSRLKTEFSPARQERTTLKPKTDDPIKQKVLPGLAVQGPKDRFYVVDHHHLSRALHDEGEQEIAVTVIANLCGLYVGVAPEEHSANRSLSTVEPVSAPPKWKIARRDRRPKSSPRGPKYRKLPTRDWGVPA
jgi:hypothetical protein